MQRILNQIYVWSLVLLAVSVVAIILFSALVGILWDIREIIRLS